MNTRFSVLENIIKNDMHKEMNEAEKEKKSTNSNPKEGEDKAMLVAPSASDNRSLVAEKKQENHSKNEESLINMVNKPSKIVRIDDMVKKILEEVKVINPPLDDASKINLQNTFQKFIKIIKTNVSKELGEEIDELVAPLSEAPTEIELRLAYTKLVGWLEGLFRGIQTILLTQQVMNQNPVNNLLAAKKTNETESKKSDDSGGQYL